MRVAIVLLVLLNAALAFWWTSGRDAPFDAPREVSLPVGTDRIRLLPPEEAGASPSSPSPAEAAR